MQLNLEFESKVFEIRRDVSLYSVVISPPDSCIEEVEKMKMELYEEIGWFGSKGSKAHNTFNVFRAGAGELSLVENFTELFCHSIQTMELVFNRLGHYEGNNAFIILPDSRTEELLKPVMQRFKKGFPVEAQFSTSPHISIGRNLRPEQLEKAYALFDGRSVHLRFLWTDLAIRKFNPRQRQYEVYKRFGFAARNSAQH